MITRIKSFFARIKTKVKFEADAKKRRRITAAKEVEFNTLDVPEGAIMLPFNHVITIRNAHALYQSFEAIGKDCVLVDMSGGDLLIAAKKNGLYNAAYNYLIFDFDDIEDFAPTQGRGQKYTPSIPDITKFTETCRSIYPALETYLSKAGNWSEDIFLQEAYESYETFFKRAEISLPKKISHRADFTPIVARHWLVNIINLIKAGETEWSKAFMQAWTLNGKYIQKALEYNLRTQKFEQFILNHKFSRAVHFCGPYTLSGVLIKYAFQNVGIPCTLFHDAFMPPDQMKKINSDLPNFKSDRFQADILYKNRSDQPAYDLEPDSQQVTLRYPIRTWASYDILGVPQDYLWATWLEYPRENVGVKNTAIAEKFTTALGFEPRVKVVGNPLIESTLDLPPEVSRERPNLLVSVAPDIFSAIRFSSTKYLTSMEAYYEELKEIIAVYAETANVIIALHPRLTSDNPHYDMMSRLGKVATSATGTLLPHIDLFLTYVGSVMNFDADELNVPMLAISLYDDAKSYSQNAFDFKDMHIIETSEDMSAFKLAPTKISLRTDKVIPVFGSTARELLTFWSALDQ